MSIDTLLQAAEYLDSCEGAERPVARRRPLDADHGYASSLPAPMAASHANNDDLRNALKRNKNKKSLGSRTTHNELEKNRRAHLRNCLEKLKDIVPLGPEASKHTTLGLLTKAKRFIKSLEERDKRHSVHKEQLAREQRYLQRRLDQLETRFPDRRSLRRRPEQENFNHHHQQLQHPQRLHHNHQLQHQHQQQQHQFQHSLSLSMMPRRSLSECSSASASSGTASRCDLPDSEPTSISESDEVDVIGYTSNQSDTDDHSSIQSGSGDSGVALSASRLSLDHMEI